MTQLKITLFLFILSPAERQTNSAPANIEKRPLSETAQLPGSQALIKPEDLEPVEPGSSLKTVRNLRRPRAVPDHFITSSSLIGTSDGPLTSGKSKIESNKKNSRHSPEHSHIFLITQA